MSEKLYLLDRAMTRRRFLIAAGGTAAATATGGILAAYARAASPGATTAPIRMGGTLTIGMDGDIVALDPAFAYDWTTNQAVCHVTEGLFRLEQGLRPVPHLAESVATPEPLTYVYKIREGISFHDGTQMTADDVVFSLRRIMDPDAGSYVGWMLGNVDSIEKTGDYEVTVTLKQPDAFWPYVLATTAGHVISKSHFEAHKADFGKPEGGLVGTGPFRYVTWNTGSEVQLARFDGYWDKASGGPYLDALTLKVLPEATTRVAGLQTGELDGVIVMIPGEQLPIVQGMSNVDLQLTPSALIDSVHFNNQRPPFDNRLVRQAINYATDKVAVRKATYGEFAVDARATMVAPSLWSFETEMFQSAYDALPDYAFDMEKARQLLQESGVGDQLNGKVIDTDTDPARLTQALAVQNAVAELGYSIEVRKLTWQELVSQSLDGAHNYDMQCAPWAADFPDPAASLVPTVHSRATAAGGSNNANYKNPSVDELLDAQMSLTDEEARAEAIIAAQAIVAEDSPSIYVNYPVWPFALNKKYAGYQFNAFWWWEAYAKNIHQAG